MELLREYLQSGRLYRIPISTRLRSNRAQPLEETQHKRDYVINCKRNKKRERHRNMIREQDQYKHKVDRLPLEERNYDIVSDRFHRTILSLLILADLDGFKPEPENLSDNWIETVRSG